MNQARFHVGNYTGIYADFRLYVVKGSPDGDSAIRSNVFFVPRITRIRSQMTAFGRLHRFWLVELGECEEIGYGSVIGCQQTRVRSLIWPNLASLERSVVYYWQIPRS